MLTLRELRDKDESDLKALCERNSAVACKHQVC
jgi:hypothetical protein